MAGIRQMQRRAIESLYPYVQSIRLSRSQQFFIDGVEVFFRGFSEGIGTCSDLHGVYFAVFSAVRPTTETLPEAPREAHGAIFLRPARTRAERNAAGGVFGTHVMVVEALRHEESASGHVVFRRIGKKKSYIPIPG